jgi:hypothetical protein
MVNSVQLLTFCIANFFEFLLAMLLSVTDVLERGLRYMFSGNALDWKSREKRELIFHKHYGSSPLVIASMWYDLVNTDIVNPHIQMSKKDKERGFKMFITAHFFLWSYPKNYEMLASRFGICQDYARGAHLWIWIERVAYLERKVIFRPKELDDPESEIFGTSTDGVDFPGWETKHATLPVDRGMCSQKLNNCAWKYQIALAVHKPQCVGIFGPRRGGEDDKTMLEKSGLLQEIKEGKLLIVDGGYTNEANADKLSWPNPQDSKEVQNFKSRARLRHETFNGRLKNFRALRDTFRHGKDKHKLVLTAVAVTVQYQMNNGSPIYTA